MKRHFALPLAFVALLLTLGFVGCGDDTDSDADVPAADTSASAEEIAEVDESITTYMAATDSLATLFNSINSIDDVREHQSEIARLGAVLREFNTETARKGQIYNERMNVVDPGPAIGRLIDARERLQGMPAVAEAVGAAEQGVEITDDWEQQVEQKRKEILEGVSG